MSTIPCETCARPNECRRDRRCNNPTDLRHARRELDEAAKAKEAAERRWSDAVLAFATAVAAQSGVAAL